jgi:hypothetical protein
MIFDESLTRNGNGLEKKPCNLWDRMPTWYLVLPPSRPSLFHLQVFEQSLSEIDRELPVAILGSTPEFRDLLNVLGFKDIYVFDKSKSFYEQTSCMRCFSNHENLILDDWLYGLPKFRNQFAAILSDLTQGNVAYCDRLQFYSSIALALREDGIFIDKVLLFEDSGKRSLRELEKKYSRLPPNLVYVNYFNCEFLFCSELLDIKQLVDTTLFYDLLDQRFEEPVLRKLLAECLKITPRDGVWYYGKEWKDIEPQYCYALEVINSFEEEQFSPYYGNLKIFVSKKR